MDDRVLVYQPNHPVAVPESADTNALPSAARIRPNGLFRLGSGLGQPKKSPVQTTVTLVDSGGPDAATEFGVLLCSEGNILGVHGHASAE